jgi:endoglucanase
MARGVRRRHAQAAGAFAVALLALAASQASGASTCSSPLLSSTGTVPVGNNCESFADCCGSGSAGARCFRKSAFFAGCKDACTPGEIDPFDGQPWECKRLTCLDGRVQAPAADASGIVAAHGKLRLNGLQLSGARGEPVQLVGVDTPEIQFRGACFSAASMLALTKDWGVSVVRVRFQAGARGGFTGDPASASQMQQLFAAVDAVGAAGVYAVVSFAPVNNGDPNAFLLGTGAGSGPAITFWRAVAQRYVGKPFVLYDIAGQPGRFDWATVLKPYHDAVIGAIRAVDPDTIILAATGNFNQRLQDPALQPVARPRHVMYSVMWASKSDSFSVVQTRFAAGAGAVPVFALGWKGSDHNESVGPDLPNSSLILNMLAGAGGLPAQVGSISWTAVALQDDDQITSLLTPGACAGANFQRLTCWGSFVQNTARRANAPTRQPTTQPTTALPTGQPTTKAPIPPGTTDRPTTSPTRSPTQQAGGGTTGGVDAGAGAGAEAGTSTGLIVGTLCGSVCVLSLWAFAIVRYKNNVEYDDGPLPAKVSMSPGSLGGGGNYAVMSAAPAAPYYPSPVGTQRATLPSPPRLTMFSFARRLYPAPAPHKPGPAAALQNDVESRDSATTAGPTFNLERASAALIQSARSVFSRETSSVVASPGFVSPVMASPGLGQGRAGPMRNDVPGAMVTAQAGHGYNSW